MARYDEQVDMLLLLGECQKNHRRAADLYRERYPDRTAKSHMAFLRLEARLRQHGQLVKIPRTRRRTVTTEDATVAVLAAVALNPHTSTRAVAADAGMTHTSVQQILHRHKFHAYHISLHQELHGNDFQYRMDFCQWMIDRTQRDQQFPSQILFSDEASFSNDGNVNRHNLHYWSATNPKWMRAVDLQHRWRVNVWCGIIGDVIVGPHFIEGTLTGDKYTRFLRDILPGLLENLPLAVWRGMWFQQDGAPPHFATSARDVLDAEFPRRWIGRAGPVNWPARSPDLTPVDFFLWGFLKDKVMATAPTTQDDMCLRIAQACANVTPVILANVRRAFRQRLAHCLQANGHHFEHLIGH